MPLHDPPRTALAVALLAALWLAACDAAPATPAAPPAAPAKIEAPPPAKPESPTPTKAEPPPPVTVVAPQPTPPTTPAVVAPPPGPSKVFSGWRVTRVVRSDGSALALPEPMIRSIAPCLRTVKKPATPVLITITGERVTKVDVPDQNLKCVGELPGLAAAGIADGLLTATFTRTN